jgi:hypothetical protein
MISGSSNMAQIKVKLQCTNKFSTVPKETTTFLFVGDFFTNAVLSGGFSDDLHELHPTFRGKQGVMPQE